ncbi:ATP phosphoribosyltransferase regulatory subunit [Pseudorhodoplanes sp.]|uniref:ATP phosphoribosyltransferase regulatory subunit n=1 Tax=Pseudorhodoplanes sp. TaxID=1934341 RepID=UPI002CDFAD0F|nr:ATP phosphoribosyltransferase regulatory subunit [Pseudorhodoplanes sp.]HWV54945.1 ATP phosphoribosyltransferase regulatory subunit [Pseudorhodoplanes sp.]
MTNPPNPALPDPRVETLVSAQSLVSTYEQAGYTRAHPAILQPADPFLDLSGEDIRARMFLTSGRAGAELCLRPDFTIPVSRDYLASPLAGRPQGFCYLGPVFRDRGTLPGEFLQAGIESFGRSDKAAADAETLSLGLATAAHFGNDSPDIRIGDVGLFAALVSALDLAPAWKRRLVKDFNRKASLAHDLDRLTLGKGNGRPDYQGVLAALAGSDPKAAHALVTDLLSIAGISAVGGRSVGEIADRFLEQSTLGALAALPPYTRTLLERFLSVTGNPLDASVEMREIAKDGGFVLTPMLDLFDARNVELTQHGIDLKRVVFSSAFGRGMDYYTGFVFELTDGKSTEPLVAGGRYDDLLTRLGSNTQIPAVGFSVWIERLAGGAS